MASEIEGNGEQVIAIHIVPSSSEVRKLPHLGLTREGMRDIRNGLFLGASVEKSFDKLESSFVQSNPLRDALNIWDNSCRFIPIWHDNTMTIGDGLELNLGAYEPFKRCLSLGA